MPPSHPVQSKQKIGQLKELMQRTIKEKQKLCGGICDGGLQLKLARTRTEVLSVGQRLQYGARVNKVETPEGDVVTAPVDYNAPRPYPDAVNDKSGDSEGRAEGSGGDAERLSAQNSQSGVGDVTR